MAISNYADFQAFVSDTMAKLGADAEFAPHERFWSTLSYDAFTQGNVPGISETVRIVTPGDAAGSAFIQALKGEGMFTGSDFRRMPAGGPFFSDEQITEIAAWIDAFCPNDDPAAGA
uniref:c-type cytochrome n=1 Tax=uncultured Rhizobium sp. TaxID=155567 RepID=UPI0026363026|nr:cytochrome c [uncultured Rhizobium sp.]